MPEDKDTVAEGYGHALLYCRICLLFLYGLAPGAPTMGKRALACLLYRRFSPQIFGFMFVFLCLWECAAEWICSWSSSLRLGSWRDPAKLLKTMFWRVIYFMFTYTLCLHILLVCVMLKRGNIIGKVQAVVLLAETRLSPAHRPVTDHQHHYPRPPATREHNKTLVVSIYCTVLSEIVWYAFLHAQHVPLQSPATASINTVSVHPSVYWPTTHNTQHAGKLPHAQSTVRAQASRWPHLVSHGERGLRCHRLRGQAASPMAARFLRLLDGGGAWSEYGVVM